MNGVIQKHLESFQAGMDEAVLDFRSRASSAVRRNARMRRLSQTVSDRLDVLQRYGRAMFGRHCQMRLEMDNFSRHCQAVYNSIGTERPELLTLLEQLSWQARHITSKVSEIASKRSRLESDLIDGESEIAQIDQRLAELSRLKTFKYVDYTEEVFACRQSMRDLDARIARITSAIRELTMKRPASQSLAKIQQKVSEDTIRVRLLRDAAEELRKKTISLNRLIPLKGQMVTTLRNGLSELTSLRRRRADLLRERRQLADQRRRADERRAADQHALAALESELGRLDDEAGRLDSDAIDQLLARVEEEKKTRDQLERVADDISERLRRQLDELAEAEREERSNKMQQIADECQEMRNENMKLQAQINDIMAGRHGKHISHHRGPVDSSHHRSPDESSHRHAASVCRGSPDARLRRQPSDEPPGRHGCRESSPFQSVCCDVDGEPRDRRRGESSVARLRRSIRELLARIEVLENAVRCQRAAVRSKFNEIEQIIAGVRVQFYLSDPDEREALTLPFHELYGRVLALRCQRRGLKKVLKCFRRESRSSMGGRELTEWGQVIDDLCAETKDRLTLARVYQFLG
jgi:hypothetical protein